MTDRQVIRVDIATARAQFSRIVSEVSDGNQFVITRYGKPVATIGTWTESASATSTNVQMEHEATAPSHRPAPEPPSIRSQQQGRDDILRGVNRSKTRG